MKYLLFLEIFRRGYFERLFLDISNLSYLRFYCLTSFNDLGFPSERQFLKHDNFFVCYKPKLFQPILYSSPTCSIMLDRRGFETDVHLSVRIHLTAMQRSSFQKSVTLSTMPVNYRLVLDCNLAWV